MKWLKKGSVMAALLLGMFFSVGFGSKKVELWEETPLIDLDTAIKNADAGRQGNPEPYGEETEEKPERNDDPKTEQQTVRDEKIKNNTSEDIEKLEDLIEEKCTDKSRIILEDDYAETHVYHKVWKAIEEQKQSIGFDFQQH